MRLIRRTFLLAALFVALPARAGDPPTASTASNAPDFAAHVRAGDRARAQGRWTEAVLAYVEALRLKDDPVVSGRLGLVLARLGENRRAANMLVRAVEDQAVLAPAERVEVLKAWESVRARVCRLTITVNQMGADVFVDGTLVDEASPGGIVLFVDPGEHKITAKLKGFHEASANVAAEKAGVATAALDLRPLEPPASSSPTVPPNSSVSRSQGMATDVLKAEGPQEAMPKPTATPQPWRIVVGAGPAVLWGLAPSPVVGPSVSVSVRWEAVSAGGAVRAMWSLPVGQEGPVIGVGAYGATAHGCGHWGPAFGCALFQLAAIELGARTGASQGSTGMIIVPALGLSGGLEVPERSRIQARIRGEVSSALRRPGTSVEGRLVWDSPGFVGGATIEAVFAF
jgi:enamine deaminase RidA (YjgF/YER057c/UK114 family)